MVLLPEEPLQTFLLMSSKANINSHIPPISSTTTELRLSMLGYSPWSFPWVGKAFWQKAMPSTCFPFKAAVKVSSPISVLYVVVWLLTIVCDIGRHKQITITIFLLVCRATITIDMDLAFGVICSEKRDRQLKMQAEFSKIQIHQYHQKKDCYKYNS